jgi:hypothetical protein
MTTLREWSIQLMAGLPSTGKEGLRSLIMLIMWEVWPERNRRVFKKECKQIQQIVEGIYDEAKAWVYAGNKGLQLILSMMNDQGDNLNGPNIQSPLVNVVVNSSQNVN